MVGGDFLFAGGNFCDYAARWNGTAWFPLGFGPNAPVNALAVLPNGNVVAGGSFTCAGPAPARRLARWDGVGWTELAGGVGKPVHDPGWNWLCRRFWPARLHRHESAVAWRHLPRGSLGPAGERARDRRARSQPDRAVAGGPATSSRGRLFFVAAPDFLYLMLPSAGTVVSQFALPDTASLVGALIYDQVVPLEFAASGAIAAVTSTNALALQLGRF